MSVLVTDIPKEKPITEDDNKLQPVVFMTDAEMIEDGWVKDEEGVWGSSIERKWLGL